jgi:hypothetical protein
VLVEPGVLEYCPRINLGLLFLRYICADILEESTPRLFKEALSTPQSRIGSSAAPPMAVRPQNDSRHSRNTHINFVKE